MTDRFFFLSAFASQLHVLCVFTLSFNYILTIIFLSASRFLLDSIIVSMFFVCGYFHYKLIQITIVKYLSETNDILFRKIFFHL